MEDIIHVKLFGFELNLGKVLNKGEQTIGTTKAINDEKYSLG